MTGGWTLTKSEKLVVGLQPYLREPARKLISTSALQGNPVQIYSGFRSSAEQDRLYAQGRSTPGKVVTPLKGGQSLHNQGRAIDVAPLVDGMIDVQSPPAQAVVDLAKKLGFEWGGDWLRQDRPHFQMPEPPPGETINK